MGLPILVDPPPTAYLMKSLYLNLGVNIVSRYAFDAGPKSPISKVSLPFHRRLLLKLDKQPHSHLLVKFCICTRPHPLQALCLVHCKKWPVDGTTDLFVQF